MKITDFIKGKVWYDYHGQMIFCKDEKVGDQLILDIRGWGAIQHLFKSEKEAAEFQDKLGNWYAEAINEKIEREKE